MDYTITVIRGEPLLKNEELSGCKRQIKKHVET
jgi:hypothetical protein